MLRLLKSRKFRLAIVGVIFLYLFAATKVENHRLDGQRKTTIPGGKGFDFSVNRSELWSDVAHLSTPEMEGRRTGTPGNHKAQDYIIKRFQESGISPIRGDYRQKFSFVRHSIRGLLSPSGKFTQPFPDATNLIGYIPGRKDSQNYIALSAHYDHLGIRDGKLYPGADDDASGIGALFAAAEYLKTHPPVHRILICAFDGEELGLRGSEAFFKNPLVDPHHILIDISMDMISHNDRNEIFIAGTWQHPEFKQLTSAVAKQSRVKMLYGHDRPKYAGGNVDNWLEGSDHYSFYEAGIPFLYFGVEDHPDYHAPTDTFDHINKEFYANVVEVVIATLHAVDSSSLR